MWVSRSTLKGIIVENGILNESSSRDRRSKNNYAKNSIKEKIISKEFFPQSKWNLTKHQHWCSRMKRVWLFERERI